MFSYFLSDTRSTAGLFKCLAFMACHARERPYLINWVDRNLCRSLYSIYCFAVRFELSALRITSMFFAQCQPPFHIKVYFDSRAPLDSYVELNITVLWHDGLELD